MDISDEPTKPSLDSEIIAYCFYTGRPITAGNLITIGPFWVSPPAPLSIGLCLHYETYTAMKLAEQFPQGEINGNGKTH